MIRETNAHLNMLAKRKPKDNYQEAESTQAALKLLWRLAYQEHPIHASDIRHEFLRLLQTAAEQNPTYAMDFCPMCDDLEPIEVRVTATGIEAYCQSCGTFID